MNRALDSGLWTLDSGPARRGWTLIELVAVVALMACLMAGALFTLKAPISAGRLQSEIDTVLMADRTARSEARRFGRPLTLTFRWSEQPTLSVERSVEREDSSSSSSSVPSAPRRLEALIGGERPGKRSAAKELAIPIDPAGRSPTYALKFASPRQTEIWLVIAGGTGQPLFDSSPRQVHELLSSLTAPQP